MKTSTVGDWIDDVFDKLDGRVVDEATRFRLISLLDSACIEGDEDAEILDRIDADDLTIDEANEMLRRLLDMQPRIPDQYAPSQSALARWIRTFCV
jgi:hypothetical protein